MTATLKVTKGTITFQGFTLISATAAVRVPDESDTTYTVRQQDLQISLEVVIVGGHVYLHGAAAQVQELTGAGSRHPGPGQALRPATGLPAVIPAGRNPQYLGAEQVDGVDSHKVSVIYSADQINGLLPELSSKSDVVADVWVGGSDHLIRKAVLGGAVRRQQHGQRGRGRPVGVQRRGNDHLSRTRGLGAVDAGLYRQGCPLHPSRIL